VPQVHKAEGLWPSAAAVPSELAERAARRARSLTAERQQQGSAAGQQGSVDEVTPLTGDAAVEVVVPLVVEGDSDAPGVFRTTHCQACVCRLYHQQIMRRFGFKCCRAVCYACRISEFAG
jgi:hypothetical protein